MFFKPQHFKKIGTLEQAEAAAAIANELIDVQGITVFGSYLKDKNGKDVLKRFSNIKEDNDSHVAVLIKPALMGSLEDDEDLEIVLNTKDREMLEAQTQYTKVLERELRSLRERDNSNGSN